MAANIIVFAVLLGYSIFVLYRSYKQKKAGIPSGCAGCSGCCKDCSGCGGKVL